MFDSAAISISTHQRVTAGTLIGEVVATAGLIIVIYTFIAREKQTLIPIAVAAWIGSAYFFTSSTSFANPAVTLGRIFSDSFAGIAPESVLPFIAAQIVGMALGLVGVSALKR
jgi:glycerol uptake facilitator-like aquaporin